MRVSWVALLLLLPAVTAVVSTSDGAALSVSAIAHEAGIDVELTSSGPLDVHVVLSTDNATVGTEVERVIALHVKDQATISIANEEILRSGTLNVTVYPAEEPLPILRGSTDLVDAGQLRERTPLARTAFSIGQDNASRTAIVAPATVAPGWHNAPMPLVTESGAIVVGYVKERQLGPGASTSAGPLFARVSWDGGRTFGSETPIGPETGEPRGHWNMVEVEPDQVLFLMDSPRDDAFVEGVVLDAASRQLASRAGYPVDAERPQEMSLTPSLAKRSDGSVLMGARHGDDGVIWRLGDGLQEVARIEGRTHPQLASSATQDAVLWTTPMFGEQPPALRVARLTPANTLLPAQDVEPLTTLMRELGADSYSGPTAPRLDRHGNLHFTFGFTIHDPDWTSYAYYVRLPPTGPASLLRLDDTSGEEGHALHHSVAVHGDRVWLLISRGWSGETFLLESTDGGQQFGATTRLLPSNGTLFYMAGTGVTNRPLAILPDGRPIVVSSWYAPMAAEQDQRLVVFPLYDPFRKADVQGGAYLVPNLEPSMHRTNESMNALAQTSGGTRLPTSSSVAHAASAIGEHAANEIESVSHRNVASPPWVMVVVAVMVASLGRRQ